MLEKLLPTHAVLGVGPEHLSDELLAHVRDVVDGSREVEVFLVNHDLELVDVLGVIWWSELEGSYLPKSIQ